MNEQRVWCVRRQGKKKIFYDLRFVHGGKSRSKCVGTDRKLAERKRLEMEIELNKGTYKQLTDIPWEEFVREHAATKRGKRNAQEVVSSLGEFGRLMNPRTPRDVRFPMIEAFVNRLRERGLSQSTVNKKLIYIGNALRCAVRRGYVAVCEMDGWAWDKVARRELRILKANEEPKLLAASQDLHGFQMHTFARFVLTTWGRLSEVTGLLWEDVRFDDASILFRSTKSHEHRFIPISPKTGLLDSLRRLQAQTLPDGGPFVRYRDKSNMNRKWHEIVASAGIPPVTIHDLRRSGITRALLAGVPPITVQRLAGHRNIATTMRYYAEVSKQDLRDAVDRLAAG